MGHVKKVCKAKKTESTTWAAVAEQEDNDDEVLFMATMGEDSEKTNI